MLCRLLLVGLVLFSSAISADEINIAVASNFAAPVKKIAARFEETTNYTANIAVASSGKHFAQIKHGAPFHVFLSADQEKPQALIESGLALKDSQFTYAVGKLIFVSSDIAYAGSALNKLTSGQFNKLALANPKLAPYGKAALETLRHLNIEQTTQSRWVIGENISQTYQFIRSGNADAGFVALSQVKDNLQRSGYIFWSVPDAMYTPIKQDAVLLKNAEHNAAATVFLQFLKSAEAASIIHEFGYTTLKHQSKMVNTAL